MASKEPLKMARAYTLTWAAEQTCLREYPSSRTNDESDACRHFIWAGLLYEAFGSSFAAEVLNAHEQDPKQPEIERAMDLANNRLGLLVAEDLKRTAKLSEESLLKAFRTHLKKGDLVVIKRRSSK